MDKDTQQIKSKITSSADLQLVLLFEHTTFLSQIHGLFFVG